MSLSPEGIHGITADSYVTVDERQGRQEEKLGESPEKTQSRAGKRRTKLGETTGKREAGDPGERAYKKEGGAPKNKKTKKEK